MEEEKIIYELVSKEMPDTDYLEKLILRKTSASSSIAFTSWLGLKPGRDAVGRAAHVSQAQQALVGS